MKFKKIIIVSVALLLAIFGVFLLNFSNDPSAWGRYLPKQIAMERLAYSIY